MATTLFKKLLSDGGKSAELLNQTKAIEYEIKINLAACLFKKNDCKSAYKILTALNQEFKRENDRQNAKFKGSSEDIKDTYQ